MNVSFAVAAYLRKGHLVFLMLGTSLGPYWSLLGPSCTTLVIFDLTLGLGQILVFLSLTLWRKRGITKSGVIMPPNCLHVTFYGGPGGGASHVNNATELYMISLCIKDSTYL